MKINAEEIKNKDVKTMNKEQLNAFSEEVNAFEKQTKFIRNLSLIKILYYVFGYAFGIGLGLCIGKNLLSYIYYGVVNNTLIILACILLVVCITLEVLYRVAKKSGAEYSKIFIEKSAEIKNQYNQLNAKEKSEENLDKK